MPSVTIGSAPLVGGPDVRLHAVGCMEGSRALAWAVRGTLRALAENPPLGSRSQAIGSRWASAPGHHWSGAVFLRSATRVCKGHPNFPTKGSSTPTNGHTGRRTVADHTQSRYIVKRHLGQTLHAMSGRQSRKTSRALQHVARGMTPYAAARREKIALSTIYNALKRARAATQTPPEIA